MYLLIRMSLRDAAMQLTNRTVSRTHASRPSLLFLLALAAVGCQRSAPAAPLSLTAGCFHVSPAGPMSSVDSDAIAKAFSIVRLDSTHLGVDEEDPNTEPDPMAFRMRYAYLSPQAESLRYRSNAWADEAHSDSIHVWAGNVSSHIELILVPRGQLLTGYANTARDIALLGDTMTPRARYMGLVRADIVVCGELQHR